MIQELITGSTILVEYDISKVTKQTNTIFDLETNDSNILQKGDLVSLTDNTQVYLKPFLLTLFLVIRDSE